ncbi:MAG: DUF1232 domain-containing protein [Leptolyngbyaceae cyanobacterium SL_1_1]|nr:DUF1232 domain-containing protein [Leptolyngbyaceae cyanobacterium SL_1_1]
MSGTDFYQWYQNLLSNPRSRGWAIALSLLYLISPFDISPDFLPILGQIDDVILISLLISGLYQWLVKPAPAQPAADPSTRTIDVNAVPLDPLD